MAVKYRALQSVKAIYDGSHQGYTNGVVNSVFIKKEGVAGVFNPPAPPIQGKSTSGATPSTDLSAGTDTTLRIAVDGAAFVTVVLGPVVGLTTGSLIAADIEAKANAALLAAGRDGRVWAEFTGGVYVIHSQTGGPHSSVVVTSAPALSVADELKLGVANGGTEVVGDDSDDYLLTTSATFKETQSREVSKQYRNYQATSTIRQKKMCEGEVGLYFNFDEDAVEPVVDSAVQLILESIFGRKEVLPGIIRFSGADPQANYLSVQQIGSNFARAINGAYPKSVTMSFPGDNIAEIKMPFKAREEKFATLAKTSALVTASAVVPLTAGEWRRFQVGARVMTFDAVSGREVEYGYDGSLSVISVNKITGEITLSAPVSLALGSFIGGYAPSLFGGCGLQEPVIGLQGKVSLDGGMTYLDTIRSVEITFDPKSEDLDNHFGSETNQGFVVADKQEITWKIEVTMTTDQFHYYQQAKRIDDDRFFSCEIILGDSAKAHLRIASLKVEMDTPAVEIPDSGTVAVSFEGKALATACGALDAIVLEFKGVGA